VIQRPETSANPALGASPRLGELHARARAFSVLAGRVRALLPGPEAAHLAGIVQCDKGIVMLVDSSAWCARLRYRAGALKAELGRVAGQPIEEIKVRVVPRGART
jgi:hypothetical protein